jgi:hypothetical protein
MGSISDLNCTAGTTIGARIVQSAAYFQAGASNLFGAQGEALQTLIASVSSGSQQATVLTTAAKQVENTLGSMYTVERLLQEKIAAWTHIHNNPNW